jgi:hypothetical protein
MFAVKESRIEVVSWLLLFSKLTTDNCFHAWPTFACRWQMWVYVNSPALHLLLPLKLTTDD